MKKISLLVPLNIEFDSINLHDNLLEYKINKKILDNTYSIEGITDESIFNDFINNPLQSSEVLNKKTLNHNIALLSNNCFNNDFIFKKVIQKNIFNNSNFDISDNYSKFSFDTFKVNSDSQLLKFDYVLIGNQFSEKDFFSTFNKEEKYDFYYFQDLNNKIVYFDTFIDLPDLSYFNIDSLKTLLKFVDNHKQNIYFEEYTNDEFIEKIESAIIDEETHYEGSDKDFCAPEPEFWGRLGKLYLKFNNLEKHDDIFNTTKKYIEIEPFDSCSSNLALILSLSLLDYWNIDSEFLNSLSTIFYNESKLAQTISLENKLPNSLITKKCKI